MPLPVEGCPLQGRSGRSERWALLDPRPPGAQAL